MRRPITINQRLRDLFSEIMKEVVVLTIWLHLRQRNGIVQNGRQVRIGPEVKRSSHVLPEAVYLRGVVDEVSCVS